MLVGDRFDEVEEVFQSATGGQESLDALKLLRLSQLLLFHHFTK